MNLPSDPRRRISSFACVFRIVAVFGRGSSESEIQLVYKLVGVDGRSRATFALKLGAARRLQVMLLFGNVCSRRRSRHNTQQKQQLDSCCMINLSLRHPACFENSNLPASCGAPAVPMLCLPLQLQREGQFVPVLTWQKHHAQQRGCT